MSLSRNQIIIIAIGLIIVIGLGLIFVFGLGKKQAAAPEFSMSFWGTENERVFRDYIDAYSKIQSNVKVVYTQIPESSYENTVISALAAGTGPDVFMFHNSWLPKHYNKITPVTETTYTISQLESKFPKVVEQDFVSGNRIYALPLYVDTLALLYNKDILDAKGLATPPKTWDDFLSAVSKIRELNEVNQITKAGAAIGGSLKSVNTAADILNLLFMQFGNPEISTFGEVRFNDDGLYAMNFYTQFANPASAYYTWNDNLSNSITSLSNGSAGMIFDYQSSLSAIKEKNPFIDVRVSSMPQLKNASQPINQANYWGLAVSKQSKYSAYAWNFILNLVTSDTNAEVYLTNSGHPPATNSLITKYQNDSKLGVFANQALTARSWSMPDSKSVKNYYSNAIDAILTGRLSTKQAMDQLGNQISSLVK